MCRTANPPSVRCALQSLTGMLPEPSIYVMPGKGIGRQIRPKQPLICDFVPSPRLSNPSARRRPLRRSSARARVIVDDTGRHLRVLIANERDDRLAIVAPLVASLGHEVVASEISADEVGDVADRLQPDVAFVGVGGNARHALDLIDGIVKEAACPVIAILDGEDHGFVREAAKLGVFAYIVDDDPSTWQNMIEIVLRRFAEYRSLEGAFGRRAIIERAKGILMERHAIREDAAFSLIRVEARTSNRRVVEVAEAILDGHPLLPPT
jgi:AmiR/NasT family two-component response regulator